MDANREANVGRDTLVRPLVHELRNAVAPIVNALHLLRRRFSADPEVPAILSLIERQVAEVMQTLDSIADAQRLAQGEVTPEYKRVELASVLRAAMNDKLATIDSRGQHLHLRSPPGTIWIDADPPRLAQAIARVLDDAARRTSEGGEIWLDIAVRADEVEIRVGDDGKEAAPDAQAQEDVTLSNRPMAIPTIDLVIARALFELHGGTMDARSRATDGQCDITIRLPRAAQPRGAPGANDAAVRSGALEEHTANRRVLLVDDNEAVRMSFSAVLRELGHDVRLAADGLEALQLAEQWRPEFVVLDVHMPKLNGYDLARRLRSKFPPTVMQLVMMSGTALDHTTLAGAKSAGFDHCVDKLSAVVALDQLLRGEGPERSAR
jgi:CheY-like chemotaxis protein